MESKARRERNFFTRHTMPGEKMIFFYAGDVWMEQEGQKVCDQRVAVYARVSTDDYRQTSSFELQRQY